jgi:tetratricopeptide (TPR) repeat protein
LSYAAIIRYAGDHIFDKLFLVLLFCSIFFSANAIPASDETTLNSLSLKDYIQPNVFYCGPTAIYLLMEYWGMENIDFNELVELMMSKTMKGTSNSSMVYHTRKYGLDAYSFTGSITLLQKLLLLKIPVIVLQDLKKGIKLGHFRIVTGVDNEKKIVRIKDPARKGIKKMGYQKFISLWDRGTSINNKRWAMIVIPAFFELNLSEITDSPLTALNRGSYFYSRFDFVNACKEFSEAVKNNPDNPDALKYYAQALIRLKSYEKALAIINKLIALRPSDAVVNDLMGLYYFYTGKYDMSLLYLKKANRLNRDSRENAYIKLHYEMVKKYMENREPK